MSLDLSRFPAVLSLPGVVVSQRTGVRIPRTAKVYPDYGEGKCVCCGEPLPPKKRKYCCGDCRLEYYIETYPFEVIHWGEFKSAILERDGNKCQDCPWTATDVHHIVPLHNGGCEFDPGNCVSLCNKCHRKRHRKRCLEPDTRSRSTTLVEFQK